MAKKSDLSARCLVEMTIRLGWDVRFLDFARNDRELGWDVRFLDFARNDSGLGRDDRRLGSKWQRALVVLYQGADFLA